MMSYRFVLSIVIVGLFVSPFAWAERVSAEGRIAAKPLLDSGVLAGADLKMEWQLNLPSKPTEKVQRLFIFGDNIFITSDSNYLFCVNRKSGNFRYGLQLTPPGLPVLGPVFYKDLLYFMVGNELKVFDPSTGAFTLTKKIEDIGLSIVYDFGMNSSAFFFACSDNRIWALDPDEFWKKYTITADDDSLINSLVVEEDFVIFATETGSIIRVSSEEPVKTWRFDIPGRITSPLAGQNNWLYAASENTKLYKFNVITGDKAWPVDFQAGAKLTKPIVLGRDVLYLDAGDAGLYAVSKASGQKVWHIQATATPAAEKDNLAYIYVAPGLLYVMDNNSGKKLQALNFSGITRHVVNTVDDVIYVSNDRGRLVAVRGID